MNPATRLVTVPGPAGAIECAIDPAAADYVALKTSEGLASMIGSFIRAEFSRNIFTKIAGIVAYPVLTAFKNRVDHRRYNGAALLGLQGLVFKSHGSADAFAFERALNKVYDATRNNLLEKVRERVAHAAPLLLMAQVLPATVSMPAASLAPTDALTD